ncbi:MAG: hypothetical protein RR791_00615 [Lachnospiraceae bacterium]
MTTEAITDFLLTNKEFFITNDFLNSAFRTVGWWLVKLLRMALDAGTTLYDYTFGMVDITSWTNLDNFIDEFRPLVTAFVFLSLVIFGFMLILGKYKKTTIFSSVLIFALVMTSSNFLFNTLNHWTVTFKDAVVNTEEETDSNVLVNANLYDLIYIDQIDGLANMTPEQVVQYDSINNTDISCININEVINYDSDQITTAEAKAILKQRILYQKGDNTTVKEVSIGWGWNSQDDTDLGNEFYYRYQFRFGTYYLSILSLILVFFCLAYKNTRIIYELFVSRIMVFLMATDMSSNQKVVKILVSIRDGYYALCLTAVTIRSFTLFCSYLGTQEMNGLVRGIIVLFITFCVIDGASIMEKITGVDAGLSSMTGKIIAGTQIARSVQQGFQQHSISQGVKNQNGNIQNLNQTKGEVAGESHQMNAMNEDVSNQTQANQENRNQQGNQMNHQDGNAPQQANCNQQEDSLHTQENLSEQNQQYGQEGMNGNFEKGNGEDWGQFEETKEEQGHSNMDVEDGAITQGNNTANEMQNPYNSVDQNMEQMREALERPDGYQREDLKSENNYTPRESGYQESTKMTENATEMFQKPVENTSNKQNHMDGYPSTRQNSDSANTNVKEQRKTPSTRENMTKKDR